MRNSYRKPFCFSIRQYGDETLQTICKPVEKMTGELKNFIKNLLYTMYEKEGIGLAAPQVGRSLRVFVLDVNYLNDSDDVKKPLVFINPQITKMEDEITKEEGCLSFPDIYFEVKRAKNIEVSAFDEKMNPFTRKASGLLSRAIQHELDHLNGTLFIEHLSKLKKLRFIKKLKSLEKSLDKYDVNYVEDETQ